ncbi:LPXTG cell wall anchor domain-containing protein [Brevibacterium casei]
MPRTGGAPLGLVGIGALLLIAGAAAFVLARRRN